VTLRTAALAALAFSLTVVIALTVLLLRPAPRSAPAAAPAPATPEPAAPGRTIKARLFYVSEDGTRLLSVERDVPFAEGQDQAREIVTAQMATPPEPLMSAIPTGTTLRALFLTDRGDAYVDVSREIATLHSGGTLDELLTVYTIVNALTINLPAIRSVQLLIDGKEVTTLAGHVDLRQPLQKNLALVQ
jgi:spore germination protein GerM